MLRVRSETGLKKMAALLCLFSVGYSQSAWSVGSAGFSNQVVGVKALGMGNSFVAVADDPSAVFFNPAGMTQLTAPSAYLAVYPTTISTDYTADNGDTDSTKPFTSVVPNLYLTTPLLKNRWSLGFGINFPYGLETHWDKSGPLRYEATDSKLIHGNYNAVLAYKFNDALSVGGGVTYAQTSVSLASQLNVTGLNSQLLVPSTESDGGKKLDGDGDGWGYNLSVLLKPLPAHSIGLSYKSEVKTTIDGETQLTGLGGASASVFGGSNYSVDTKTEMTFPPSLIFGYAFRPNRWTLAMDGEWTGYSTIQEQKLEYSGEADPTRLSVLNTGNPSPKNWKDSFNAGLGANYQINNSWQGRFGFYHSSKSVPESTWSPSISESSRNAFTFGTGYSTHFLTVDFAYNYILFPKRTIHNSIALGSINGTYETTAHVFAVGLTLRK